jgi:hypothetical protein
MRSSPDYRDGAGQVIGYYLSRTTLGAIDQWEWEVRVIDLGTEVDQRSNN